MPPGCRPPRRRIRPAPRAGWPRRAGDRSPPAAPPGRRRDRPCPPAAGPTRSPRSSARAAGGPPRRAGRWPVQVAALPGLARQVQRQSTSVRRSANTACISASASVRRPSDSRTRTRASRTFGDGSHARRQRLQPGQRRAGQAGQLLLRRQRQHRRQAAGVGGQRLVEVVDGRGLPPAPARHLAQTGQRQRPQAGVASGARRPPAPAPGGDPPLPAPARPAAAAPRLAAPPAAARSSDASISLASRSPARDSASQRAWSSQARLAASPLAARARAASSAPSSGAAAGRGAADPGRTSAGGCPAAAGTGAAKLSPAAGPAVSLGEAGEQPPGAAGDHRLHQQRVFPAGKATATAS